LFFEWKSQKFCKNGGKIRALAPVFFAKNDILIYCPQISIGGDEEDDMSDEIRAAYEVFLQEQVCHP
jgi:hypothetical protein